MIKPIVRYVATFMEKIHGEEIYSCHLSRVTDSRISFVITNVVSEPTLQFNFSESMALIDSLKGMTVEDKARHDAMSCIKRIHEGRDD